MVKIAAVQFNCSEDKEKNLAKAVKLWEMAVDKGAKIICFQELFNTSWFPKDENDKNIALAEPIPGETTNIFLKKSKEMNVVTICPLYEKGRNGNYYNSAAVMDHRGEILGVYRKNHIPHIPLWNEKFYFRPGDKGFPIFKTEYATIGIQICWDNFFPEGSRILALKGAEIVFAPTACAFASHEKWEKIICGNAISNNLFVVRINRVGSEEKQDFYGKSFCANPHGEIISGPTGLNDGILIADINLKTVQDVRNQWSFFRDRRRKIYGEIVRLGSDDVGEEDIHE
jgi:N-carbamoylputrescine amidase